MLETSYTKNSVHMDLKHGTHGMVNILH